MSRTTIAISKFVGSISLGLLTGVSYTLATTTTPSLLALPTSTVAASTFTKLKALATTHQAALSATSITSLLLAYGLSPKSGRHPYLLWTALTVALSGGVDFWLKRKENKYSALEEGLGRNMEEGKINGEGVREGMERWRWGQALKGGLEFLGFGMSVVGIWGDGF